MAWQPAFHPAGARVGARISASTTRRGHDSAPHPGPIPEDRNHRHRGRTHPARRFPVLRSLPRTGPGRGQRRSVRRRDHQEERGDRFRPRGDEAQERESDQVGNVLHDPAALHEQGHQGRVLSPADRRLRADDHRFDLDRKERGANGEQGDHDHRSRGVAHGADRRRAGQARAQRRRRRVHGRRPQLRRQPVRLPEGPALKFRISSTETGSSSAAVPTAACNSPVGRTSTAPGGAPSRFAGPTAGTGFPCATATRPSWNCVRCQ